MVVDRVFGGWLHIAIWKLLQRLASLEREIQMRRYAALCASALQMLGEGGGDGDAGVAGEAGGEVVGQRAGHFGRAAATGG